MGKRFHQIKAGTGSQTPFLKRRGRCYTSSDCLLLCSPGKDVPIRNQARKRGRTEMTGQHSPDSQ